MLALATRDVSRSYRLIRKGIYHAEGMAVQRKGGIFWGAAGLRSRQRQARLGEQPVLRLRFYQNGVHATRDVSRSYRLICKGFTMPKAWPYIERVAFLGARPGSGRAGCMGAFEASTPDRSPARAPSGQRQVRLGEQPVLRLRFYQTGVHATRDVSRSYRLIRKGIYHAEGMALHR